MEEKINEQHKSVYVQIVFNDKMDNGEVSDFLDRALSKYCYPEDVVRDYEYWYED